MKEKRLFAIDLGASGGKCFAGTFTDGAFSMEEVHRFPHEGVSFYLPDKDGDIVERAHWDDVHLYHNIVLGLKKYAREIAPTLDSIGIDTWGADGHFVNEDGEMLGKIYCYRDHHLDNMADVVKARVGARRMYEITGIHFQPFNVSNQIHWFVTNRQDLLRPGCSYLPIPTVFYYYLGGVKKVDSSWASVTQLMDAQTGTWSAEILDKLEIPPEILPEIVPPGTVVGQLHAELADAVGLNRAALIAVAAHDTASAFAAAPISDPAESLIISSGTWSLVGKIVPKPITSEEAMAANISNEGGIGNTRFLKNCMGTWILQELRRVWRGEDGSETSWDKITSMAEAAQPFTTFIDPDDAGFYNPANMQLAIEEFCRRTAQPVPEGRGALLRTCYESLALKYRTVNEQICGATGTKTSSVNIVGGGSKDALLNRFTADALGLPVLAGPKEATAVGNFMVQAVGLGLLGSIQDAMPIVRQAFPIREYTPGDTASWEEAYGRFCAVVG
ncbi:MAG: rhamnulokinase [Lentisphaerae bacterium]|nr:rhamnulokinase [Lentisphaerota bacterium]